MDLQRIAGYLFIASFIFLVLGAASAPQGAYTGPDMGSRLRVIADNQGRWRLSKVFDGLAIFTPAIATLVLALALRGKQPSLPLVLAIVGFLTSGLVGVALVYWLAVDPETAFTSSFPPIVDIPGSLGMVMGMLSLAWAYLQGAFPPWLGTLSGVAGGLGILVYLVTGGAGAFYVAAILYLVNTVIGVALTRLAP